jgi:UDP-N-acetylmuramoyl-tripeptide--D-alanyl-D-alanine ligase
MKKPSKFREFRKRAVLHIRKSIAAYRRKRMTDVPIIAVTGSSGKSTTVGILDHILSGELDGKCGIGSNRINAISKMLVSTPKDTDYIIHEISGEFPGAIDERIELLQPNMAIVMTIGLDHYKAFRSREAVAAEKGKLVERLPADGIAILNADDPHVLPMAGRTAARVVTFGLSEGADVRAIDVTCTWPDRLSFTVEAQGVSKRIETQFFGKHFTSSVLAAIAAALQLGLSLDTCAERLASVMPVYQRMSIHRHPSGAWLIADTYKAPVWSLVTSFAVLEGARAPRRTIIIGNLSDVTGDDGGAYRKAGHAALEMADRVVFWGEKAARARKLKNGPTADRVTLIDTFVELIEWLDQNLVEDEVVLLKAGIKNHLERAFLVPKYGAFCMLDRCTRAGTCIDCKVMTQGIKGFRDEKRANN